MNCPSCATELIIEKRNNTDVSFCPGCSGMLLTEANVLKIAPALKKYAADPEGAKRKGYLQESPRTCPACNINYMLLRHENIELDFCTSCRGLWFDNNELESILSYMKKKDPEDQTHAGVTSGSAGSSMGDIGVEIVLGFLGEAVSGIFESIFD